MDASVVARLLSRSFKPFDLITVSGHSYLVEEPQHCRIVGDQTVFVWSPDGSVELIDLNLVERVSINDTFGFGQFEQFVSE